MTKKGGVGGFFDIGLSLASGRPRQSVERFFDLAQPHYRFLNSGRACLAVIMDILKLRNKKVLIPDYLCGEIIMGLLDHKNIEYDFYPIGRDLKVNTAVLRDKLLKNDVAAILVINYFGIINMSSAVLEIRKMNPGIKIIQDCVQDPFLLHFQRFGRQKADVVFTSFRKMFPVIEGAVFRTARPLTAGIPLPSGYNDFFGKNLIAAVSKNYFLNSKVKTGMESFAVYYFDLAKKELGFQPCQMTPFSYDAMSKLDIKQIGMKRRSNYIYMAKLFKKFSWVKVIKYSLSKEDVPLICPVLVPSALRDGLRGYLRKHRVFCPVHWPVYEKMKRKIGEDACFVAECILGVPIDQRYDREDLDYVAKLFRCFGTRKKI